MEDLTIEHIDPRNGTLVSGLCNEYNEVLADGVYNSRKTNRFVPYRVCEHPAPVTFGDVGEFLIGGEWVVCEFGGPEWWGESNFIGNGCTKGGETSGRMKTPNQQTSRSKVGKESGGVNGPQNMPKMLSHPNTVKQRSKNGRESLPKMLSHPNTLEQQRRNGEVNGPKNIAKISRDVLVKNGETNGRERAKRMTREDRARGAEGVNKVRMACTTTGYVSTPGGLTSYQRARGIDTSLRVRIN